LSVPTRVRILEILKVSTLCVNALANELGMTAAAVSQHLRILRDADLIRPEKRGYFVHYVVNWEVLEQWRRLTQSLLTPPLDRVVGDKSQSGTSSEDQDSPSPGS
jgi:DNA-binding transcriptional ArsR family regulator